MFMTAKAKKGDTLMIHYVLKNEDGSLNFDVNHPLAGKMLELFVQVVDVMG